jgi:CheY-like chemotaxis protein
VRTALVVDDDLSIREILGHYMSKMGYHSLFAHDGQSALRVLRASSVDIVLCDLEMAGMNGLDLIHSIQASPQRDVPVIVLSGHPDLLEQARHIAQAVLTKPVRYAQLEPVVLRLCQLI